MSSATNIIEGNGYSENAQQSRAPREYSHSFDLTRRHGKLVDTLDFICALLSLRDERDESDVRRYCPRDASWGSI